MGSTDTASSRASLRHGGRACQRISAPVLASELSASPSPPASRLLWTPAPCITLAAAPPPDIGLRDSMEDPQPQDVEVLPAYVEGLEAALSAFTSDTSAGASLRRLARSLTSASTGPGMARAVARARALLDAADADMADAAHALLEELRRLARATSPRAPIHVLLVEDNRTVATVVKAHLEAPTRTVHVAETAAEAEAILEAEAIDVIVLDLILPDRDGRDLLLQLREQPDTAAVPVIVLSAKGGTVARAECLAVGASEFHEKPADPAELRDAVSRHVTERRKGSNGLRDRGTGLLNRAGIIDAHRARPDPLGRISVAILAVNELDDLSQSLGERAADDLLRRVASEIRATLGEEDVIGRWSASELVALLPRKSTAEVKTVLKQGLSRLADGQQLSEWQDRGIAISFSAGVVEATREDVRDAVSAAEQSMFRARRGKKVVSLDARQSAPDHPPRILLVEDDRVTATLIHHRLVRDGFEVMDFLNGEDAYDWASSTSFDLAILDVKVPGMDGFELLERLRSIDRLSMVPIVMLTGLGSESDVIRGLELGASDYMLKPFSPTELLARVRRLIHARGKTTGDTPEPGKPTAEAGAR